jgi:hypothetical protein
MTTILDLIGPFAGDADRRFADVPAGVLAFLHYLAEVWGGDPRTAGRAGEAAAVREYVVGQVGEGGGADLGRDPILAEFVRRADVLDACRRFLADNGLTSL